MSPGEDFDDVDFTLADQRGNHSNNKDDCDNTRHYQQQIPDNIATDDIYPIHKVGEIIGDFLKEGPLLHNPPPAGSGKIKRYTQNSRAWWIGQCNY